MKHEAEAGCRLAWNKKGLGGKGVVRKRMRKPGHCPGWGWEGELGGLEGFTKLGCTMRDDILSSVSQEISSKLSTSH